MRARFNAFNVFTGKYAEFAVDTSSITGKQTFYIYFGKSSQTSLSNSSISPSGTDNAGLQFNAIQTVVTVYSVYLLVNVEPQTTFAKGMQLTFKVTVLNQMNPQLKATLTLTITGPGAYSFYDFQPINVAANSVGKYSFSWVVPNIEGIYVVATSLVPAQLSAYDAVWLKVS